MIALIFDWDGVVINSGAHHCRAWEKLAEEMGRPFSQEVFDRIFGLRNEDSLVRLGWAAEDELEKIRKLDRRKEGYYREFVREDGLTLLPGVENLLNEIRQVGIPAAVGTSTDRENIELGFEILGVGDAFRTMVTAEDVTRGKPAPDVFLKAAEKLGRDPSESLVIEDAPHGLEAAQAAGMKRVAVTTTHRRDQLDADLVVDSLKEVNLAILTSLVLGEKT